MPEHQSFVSILISLKGELVATLAVVFGGIAHALDQVRRYSWKGWVVFLSDIFVSIFIGYFFFQVAVLFNPSYGLLAAMFGTFTGTHGFNAIKEAVFSALRSIIK